MLLRKNGFTLVEIFIVIAVIALLASIAIPNLLRAQISAHDKLAKAVLYSLSSACESFAKSNSGIYPPDMTALKSATPSYLNKEYCGLTLGGYTFACTFAPSSYTFTATPVTAGASGSTTWTMTTGGVLTP